MWPLPDQASGLVPIVEPEVLLDGEHDIDRTLEVAEAIWAETFKYMADQKVCLGEGVPAPPLPPPEQARLHARGLIRPWARPLCRALSVPNG